MIWTREEYLAHMTFEASPREMFCELFGPLVGLDAEWRAQGANEDEISLRAFGWDSVKYAWAPADTGARTALRRACWKRPPRTCIPSTKWAEKCKCASRALPCRCP